ncbi:MAG: carbohydrate-binding family 9-like protein [Candidatus Firestonebacteria bacterium]
MAIKRYVCKKINRAIKITGKVNKAVWKNIKPITDFETPWAKKGDLQQKTECRICRDEEFLYVGYLAHDIDIRFLNRGRKGNVYLDDVVEIFLDPTPKDKHYFGFEVNAGGFYLDYTAKFYRIFDYKWSAKGFKTKTSIKKGKYFSCEMAIPFAALKRYPLKGEKWKMGLYRVDYNKAKNAQTEEYQLWQPNGNKTPDYHTEKSFGELVFA